MDMLAFIAKKLPSGMRSLFFGEASWLSFPPHATTRARLRIAALLLFALDEADSLDLRCFGTKRVSKVLKRKKLLLN